MAEQQPFEIHHEGTSSTQADNAGSALHDSAYYRQQAEHKAQQGDTRGFIELYSQAVLHSERERPADLAIRLEAIDEALESGKIKDSDEKQLTQAQRNTLYRFAATLVQQAVSPVETHDVFAAHLKSVGKIADAKFEYERAVSAADSLPIDQLQRLARVASRDIVANTDPKWKEALNSLQDTAGRASQIPIGLREEAARFYLSHAVGPDGTRLKDNVITGYQDGAMVIAEKDTGVLDITQAEQLLSEAVSKNKQINNIDWSKEPSLDPGLTLLMNVIRSNANQPPNKLE